MKNLFYQIKTVFDYLPVIWKDRDWDYGYLLILIQYKLKRMAKFHRKKGIHTDADEIAQQIDECSELCDRLTEFDYFQENDNLIEEQKARERDKNILFDKIKKSLFNWWD